MAGESELVSICARVITVRIKRYLGVRLAGPLDHLESVNARRHMIATATAATLSAMTLTAATMRFIVGGGTASAQFKTDADLVSKFECSQRVDVAAPSGVGTADWLVEPVKSEWGSSD
jgi:hypothetical protein